MQDFVRLKLARQEFFSGGGFSGGFVPLSVKVKNLSFFKNVSVLFTTDGSLWNEAPLAFASHFGDYDVFSGEVNGHVAQFAIRYSIGGETHFDNNFGPNYRLISRHAIVGGNIVLSTARARRGFQAGGGFTFTTSYLEGEILVNNLAFGKNVGVRLSVDGGRNWFDSHGVFAGEHISSGTFVGGGAEVWRFRTPELNLDNSSSEFRFAVFYQDLATGAVFWDNNFGQDYKVSKADGAFIE